MPATLALVTARNGQPRRRRSLFLAPFVGRSELAALMALLLCVTSCERAAPPPVPSPPGSSGTSEASGAPRSAGPLKGYECDADVCYATLPQLIANIATFDGTEVVTTGYLTVGYESTRLCPYREDLEFGTANSLRVVELPGGMGALERFEYLEGEYVRVRGTLLARPDGQAQGHAGDLIVREVGILSRGSIAPRTVR